MRFRRRAVRQLQGLPISDAQLDGRGLFATHSGRTVIDCGAGARRPAAAVKPGADPGACYLLRMILTVTMGRCHIRGGRELLPLTCVGARVTATAQWILGLQVPLGKLLNARDDAFQRVDR